MTTRRPPTPPPTAALARTGAGQDGVPATPTRATFDLSSLSPEHASAVVENLGAAFASNTTRAYTSHWNAWAAWCAQHGHTPLPATAAAVAAYASSLAERGLKAGTVARHLEVISRRHTLEAPDAPNPVKAQEVRLVRRGINRRVGSKSQGKAPLAGAVLVQLLAQVPREGLRGLRDRALLLVGFAGAFRRSELVAVDVEHLTWRAGTGVVVLVPRSKTDQEGHGMQKALAELLGVDGCPVAALRAWLDAAAITNGPVFRNIDRHDTVRERLTAQSVALIVKKYAILAGLDPKQFAGHSLRAGYVTHGFDTGADAVKIMEMTGHTGLDMLLRYRRVTDPFANTVSDMLARKKK